MPPRFPVADHATFRDLNIFEERLKETAASLQRRKHKYQLFLIQQLVVVTVLLVEVFLPPQSSLLGLLYKIVLGWIGAEVYDEKSVKTPHPHPYITSGLLFVSVTTLVLFFASGMYYDKIAYANKYVPHANKSLRSYNMYFNTRKPPLHSKFKLNPLSFFFPRPSTSSPSSPHSHSPSPSSSPLHSRISSTSSMSSSSRRSTSSTISSSSSSSSRPIPTIPPATNPRGELIFSSRIDKSFREGYERYRSVFEKKRTEALLQIHQQKQFERWGWFYKLKFWGSPISPPTQVQGQVQVPGCSIPSTPSTPTRTPTPTSTTTAMSRRSSDNRGRGGGGGGSRSGTPTPPSSSDRITTRQRDRSGSPGMSLGAGGGGGRSTRRNQKDGEKMDIRMKALERSLLSNTGS